MENQITFKRIGPDYKKFRALARLNKKSFPGKATLSKRLLLLWSKADFVNETIILLDNKLAGFYITMESPKSIYLWFICIDKKYRDHNLGSLALEKIKKYAKENKAIVVADVEYPEDDTNINDYRHKLINFYEKNGLKLIGKPLAIDGKLTGLVASDAFSKEQALENSSYFDKITREFMKKNIDWICKLIRFKEEQLFNLYDLYVSEKRKNLGKMLD